MQKYYSIEFLRFLCALAVAIYHWGLSFDLMNMESNQTFNFILGFIYQFGDKAVPVFFVISGLVFANVYLPKKKNETLYSFTIKRFARLYPLHLMTLFLIFFIQILFFKIYGKYELYTYNDFYHFFLNLTFLLGWNFELGRSFNTPVWTVGQEIFIYFLFFSLIFLIKKYRIRFIVLLYLLFLIIDKTKFVEIGYIKNLINFSYFVDFVRFFFSGVLIYYIIEKFRYSKRLFLISILLLIISFIGTFKLHLFCFSTVLVFVIFDNFKLNYKCKKIFTILGSLTYSIYLLHTLTFLLFLFFFKFFDMTYLFYYNITFLIYIIFTLILSLISFKFFESKLNKLIRKKFIDNK